MELFQNKVLVVTYYPLVFNVKADIATLSEGSNYRGVSLWLLLKVSSTGLSTSKS